MHAYRYSGDDLAAAFNRPLPSAPCATCGHARGVHRREVVKPGMFDGIEEHHECRRRDRRRKGGMCPCAKFAELEQAGDEIWSSEPFSQSTVTTAASP